jgi:ABC-2 type transport system ATP-binding protein
MLCDRVGIIKDGITVKEMSIAEIGEYTIKKVEVTDLKINEELKRFDYRTENENKTVFNIPRKELKEFLSLLSKNNFSDIQIRNPSLEETFMDFYG